MGSIAQEQSTFILAKDCVLFLEVACKLLCFLIELLAAFEG